MGLKQMIKDIIPMEWEYILRKEHKLCAYVDLVYTTHCSGKATPERTRLRITRVKRALVETSSTGESTSFWFSANFIGLCCESDYQSWSKINNEIQKYKVSCR